MDCSIAALLACLFLDAGVSYQDAGYYTQTHTVRFVEGGGRYDDYSVAKVEKSPYGRVALGMSVPISAKLTAELAVSHVSSVMDGDDKGINSVSLVVRWRPFRSRQ